MKKLVLLLLLMFAVPVHSVLVSMSAYAHQGEGEDVHHAANHQNQHKQLPGGSDKGSGKLNNHCGLSHCGGLALVFEFTVLPAPPSAPALFAYRAVLHRTPIPERPERPNWFSASI